MASATSSRKDRGEGEGRGEEALPEELLKATATAVENERRRQSFAELRRLGPTGQTSHFRTEVWF
jgi:hypothetical protein